MIKLILSEPFDLREIGSEYEISKLYLGYVKQKGYVLIHENNNVTFFNCIKSDKDPVELDINWDFDTDEIKKINNILNDNLKYIPNDKLMDIKTDIIGSLLQNLSETFDSSIYTPIREIKNKNIKSFALNPVQRFDYYEKLDQSPLEKDEYKAQRSLVYNNIEEHLLAARKIFMDNVGKIGINKDDNYVPVINDKEFIKLFNSIINDSFGNPIVNIKYGNGKQKLNAINAIDYITEEFNIKGVYNHGQETIYYFNDKLNYFEPLTEEILKNIIIKDLGIKLLKSDYSKIYNSFETNNKEYSNILVFRNILFDMDYMEELNYPICNYDRMDYLAPSLIGYEDENNEIQLLDFDFDFDYMSLHNTDPNPNEITFVEETLRKILIPKDDPSDLTLFHDFLQRVGSCILGKNPYKVITLYYGDGNNGKGVLKLLIELVYNIGAYPLTPQTFEDTFNLKSFMNRKVLLLDEIDKNDFKNLKPTLKRISSPEARIEQRAMQKSDNLVLKNFPMLIIFANEFLNLNLDETALFTRSDFLKLPNYFVDEKELNKKPNSYLVDRNTETKIKKDIKGLCWFITASIESFKNMLQTDSTFLLRQTAEQTMDILLDTDYLTKFIILYTEEDLNLLPTEFTTAEEIMQQYKQYMEINGKIISDTDITIKRRIGTIIKQVYNIKGKLTDSDMYHKQNNITASYRIKLKSFDDVNKEFRRIYIINEDATSTDLIPLDWSSENRIVYNKIVDGVNTINLLNKYLPNQDNYKIVKELLNLNLIKKTTEINLTDELE